ncbi:MAG: D-glycero-beta-D-manno-heptose 1-phosphate adenylyltransferase [Phycisphaerae bacterium]
MADKICGMDHLIERLQSLGQGPQPRVALIGDFILDRYVYGDVERINPEAPVPVLRTVRSASSVGGAGNVAAAVGAFGGRAACVGVIGSDGAGDELNRLLLAAGAETSNLVRLKDRPTSLKTRYVGLAQHRHAQQMLRVDDESVEPLPPALQATLRASARGLISEADIVIFEDYNKGVLTDASAAQFIADAASAGKKVMVDPARISDFGRYRGCWLIKPNRYEAATATGVKITDDASLEKAARELIRIVQCQAVVISLDKEGMYLCAADGPGKPPRGKRIPHRHPRSVYDVTGAGDETMAVLSVALAEGATSEEAVELANVAGGLEVERFGFVPITRQEVTDELRRIIGLRGDKVLDRRRLADEVARRRRRGETVVFTNGCFDLLHMGHVRYLQQARELGDLLIVAINSDDSTRRLKGPSRPVIGQRERAEMLAALECVDFVTIFDEDTPIPLLELLRPEVLAKGGTTPVVVGRELVEKYGGKVLTLDKVDGLSTTQIIDRIAGKGPGNSGQGSGLVDPSP